MPRREDRPVPYKLSDWGDRRDIIYKCPVCTQSFKFFGQYEKYCHNCGVKIKWANMPKMCTEDQRMRLDAAERAYYAQTMDFLDYEQKKTEILYEIYCAPDYKKEVDSVEN